MEDVGDVVAQAITGLEAFEDNLMSVVWMVYDAPTESVRSLNTTFESL